MPAVPRVVLLRGGTVHAPGQIEATAMVTTGDKVTWVGPDGEADRWAEASDSVVELGGRLVTPGFVDAHVHLSKTGFALQSVDLSRATSANEALQMIEAHATTATSSAVVFAHGWDETGWPSAQPFTAEQLDAVVGDRVAYVSRVDGHSAVVSTALLTRESSIAERDGWRGNGLVARDAHHVARSVLDDLRSADERRAALLLALRTAASGGVTELHEINAPHIAPYDDADLISDLAAHHVLPEVVPYWGALHGGDYPEAPVAGFAGDLCVDGAIGSRTAALLAPYTDAPSEGNLYLDDLTVRDHVVWCTERGVQAGFHVIGDRGEDTVLAGLRQAADKVGVAAMRATRHRLEHVEMIQPVGVALLAELGIVASVQPAFDAAWGGPDGLYERRLGAARSRPMNPLASLHRAGVLLAFGSDSPVTPIDPWGGVRAAAWHHNPDERLSVGTAFDAHTRGGHRAHADDAAGTLQPGAAATYVVWDAADRRAAGLPTLEPGTRSPQCVRTVVGGRTAYDDGTLA